MPSAYMYLCTIVCMHLPSEEVKSDLSVFFHCIVKDGQRVCTTQWAFCIPQPWGRDVCHWWQERAQTHMQTYVAWDLLEAVWVLFADRHTLCAIDILLSVASQVHPLFPLCCLYSSFQSQGYLILVPLWLAKWKNAVTICCVTLLIETK